MSRCEKPIVLPTPAGERTPEQQQIFAKNPVLRINGSNLYQYNQKAADDLKTYDQRIGEIRSRKPFEDFLRVLTEVPGEVPVTYLFHRGNLKQPRDAMDPGGLTISAQEGQSFTIQENDPNLPTTGRRLAYARWLTSGTHRLTGRVLMNRVWMHHLGRILEPWGSSLPIRKYSIGWPVSWWTSSGVGNACTS